MGLIKVIGHAIELISAGIATNLAASEFKAWSPLICDKVTEYAVSILPADKQERMADEWKSHLYDTPGNLGKIWQALGFIRAARQLSETMPLNTRLFLIFGNMLERPDLINNIARSLLQKSHQLRLLKEHGKLDFTVKSHLTFSDTLGMRWALVLDALDHRSRFRDEICRTMEKVLKEAIIKHTDK